MKSKKFVLPGVSLEEDTKRLKRKRPDIYRALKNPGPRISLAWNLIKLRDKKKMTQVELARRAGISSRTIISIEDENGNYSPTLGVIDGIAKALKVTASDLVKNVDLTKNFKIQLLKAIQRPKLLTQIIQKRLAA
jgi:transcriptional regulator with XRE-family HTH domain